MLSSLHARMMRTAISPRLATNTFSNMGKVVGKPSGRPDLEQRLAELNGFAVFNKDLGDHTPNLGFDFVHHLHGFNDADHGFRPHFSSNIYIRGGIWGR